MMNNALLHHYRSFRRHQLNTYGNSGLRVLGNDGKYHDAREFTGGGAVYGKHAYATFCSAKSQIHFRKKLKKAVKGTKLKLYHNIGG